jgi:hypothetical protein
LYQVDDLFELNVKLRCQKGKVMSVVTCLVLEAEIILISLLFFILSITVTGIF